MRFIPGDLLICKSTQKIGHYQKEINTSMRWVTEKAHPHLPQNCGFVVDTATYQNVFNDGLLCLHRERQRELI
jgi:hypothetical protein